MILTLADAVVQLRGPEAGGFDFSENQAVSLLQEGVGRLAAASQWVRAELQLGPTVAGQEAYELPDKVVKLKNVYVGGMPFTEVSFDDVFGLKNGRLQLVGAGSEGGVFTERFSEDGLSKFFSLWPVPEDALEVLGLAAIIPDPPGLNDPLPFPVDMNRVVLDYAKGIAYEDVDENQNAGNHFLERAGQKAQQLLERGNARAGRGPYKIPVAGHRR